MTQSRRILFFHSAFPLTFKSVPGNGQLWTSWRTGCGHGGYFHHDTFPIPQLPSVDVDLNLVFKWWPLLKVNCLLFKMAFHESKYKRHKSKRHTKACGTLYQHTANVINTLRHFSSSRRIVSQCKTADTILSVRRLPKPNRQHKPFSCTAQAPSSSGSVLTPAHFTRGRI